MSSQTAYRDWKRRKCPGCGSRRTVKRQSFDHAVEEFSRSLRLSPPPYPPTPSAVSATFTLLKEMFPDSSPVTVLLDVYQAAVRRTTEEPTATEQPV